jgi:hypothetical protein
MSKAWKGLEYKTAEILGGKRVIRKSYSEKNVDVKIKDFPTFKIDTKRYKKFRVFSFYEQLKKKYCKKPKDKAILVLRQHNKATKLAVIDLELLGNFLNYIRSKNECNIFN